MYKLSLLYVGYLSPKVVILHVQAFIAICWLS